MERRCLDTRKDGNHANDDEGNANETKAQQYLVFLLRKIQVRFSWQQLYQVSRFVDDNYLKNLGIKNLVDSMADGDCEKIPCSNFKSKDSKDDSKKGKTIIY
ncbi:hypothetical protein CEXT_128771 [Caerostris extrusa]|uniref:Uncharacterized protein n=1 Tax=Caerostris extrusa TaxID=172846 RepID=A0AAV4RCV4_CAEEX|nr:hypothetical protein CEXT_128771 [Caerostris extrusa]